MSLLIGALTIGLILSLLALGVFVSFRVFEFPDITTEGSITLGAAVAAVLIVKGKDPFFATMAATGCGLLAGALTGILHTRFKINNLLAGILMMTALYSVNLRVMSKSNVPLITERTLTTYAEQAGMWVLSGSSSLPVFGWDVSARDASTLVCSLLVVVVMALLLYLFFRTNVGNAMRATGDNQQMIRALGVNTGDMIILGLALANGLVALSGALLAQYQGFADVQMGIGMVVWGLASVIIGETLVGVPNIGLRIAGAVMGSIIFRLLVAIALRWGLNPNDLKLITAVFVFAALVLPGAMKMLRKRKKARVLAHA